MRSLYERHALKRRRRLSVVEASEEDLTQLFTMVVAELLENQVSDGSGGFDRRCYTTNEK